MDDPWSSLSCEVGTFRLDGQRERARHTHRAYLSKEPGLIVMNPGTPELSYGVIEMENDLVTDVRLEDAAADLAYI